MATRELATIGLARPEDVSDGCVFRVKDAYPIYDAGYAVQLQVVREFAEGLTNLQTIGRNGTHRYNNQDHAALSGLLAARNLLHDRRYDVWSIATEADYFEEAPGAPARTPSSGGGRISIVVPAHRAGRDLEASLHSIACLDPPPWERILVCDGEVPGAEALAANAGFLLERSGRRRGPAAARNAGVRRAAGDVLLFLDSDVLVQPDLVARVSEAFARDPGLSAVFGSYDDDPADRSLVSRGVPAATRRARVGPRRRAPAPAPLPGRLRRLRTGTRPAPRPVDGPGDRGLRGEDRHRTPLSARVVSAAPGTRSA
ncbi:MAG: glycosyltransferase [Vicinamibacteria bacterium]